MRALVGMKRSRVQWAALAILSASSAILATKPAHAYMAALGQAAGGANGASLAAPATRAPHAHTPRPPPSQPAAAVTAYPLGVPLGIWATAASALLSGGNQAASEIALRGPAAPAARATESAVAQRRAATAFSREMAMYKLAFAVVGAVLGGGRRTRGAAGAGADSFEAAAGSAAGATTAAWAAEAWGGMWRGWRFTTIVPCVLSACGGVLVGQVTALAGGDWKGYALVGGVAWAALCSHALRAERVSPDTALAAVLIVASMALYAGFPAGEPGAARRAAPPRRTPRQAAPR